MFLGVGDDVKVKRYGYGIAVRLDAHQGICGHQLASESNQIIMCNTFSMKYDNWNWEM